MKKSATHKISRNKSVLALYTYTKHREDHQSEWSTWLALWSRTFLENVDSTPSWNNLLLTVLIVLMNYYREIQRSAYRPNRLKYGIIRRIGINQYTNIIRPTNIVKLMDFLIWSNPIRAPAQWVWFQAWKIFTRVKNDFLQSWLIVQRDTGEYFRI